MGKSYRVFLSEENEHIKNEIRQKFQFKLNEIHSISSRNIFEKNVTTIDYFQLIYECIETRQILLHFVDFKTRSQTEPDVDLAILQAILIGNIKGVQTLTIRG